ncbi:MAG: transcriptional repressor [Bacteroidales bacterium]|nr:transcriptional repressor [Bacteroidales bacterium]MCF8389135.1 transcriptional repressor [Bacteroidales bacterium]
MSLTRSRVLLIKILYETDYPLSGKEIEGRISGECDLATIYRNLNAFSEKGLVQRILSDEAVKYKMNGDWKNKHKKSDHVHFECSKCHKLICMEELRVKDYILPEGFSKIENQFLILGICDHCNEK